MTSTPLTPLQDAVLRTLTGTEPDPLPLEPIPLWGSIGFGIWGFTPLFFAGMQNSDASLSVAMQATDYGNPLSIGLGLAALGVGVGTTITSAIKRRRPLNPQDVGDHLHTAARTRIVPLPGALYWTASRSTLGIGLLKGQTDVSIAIRTSGDRDVVPTAVLGERRGDTLLLVVPDMGTGVDLAGRMLYDFAVATQALSRDPAWVGPDRNRAFTVKRSTGEITTALVRVGRNLSWERAEDVYMGNVTAFGERALVSALWPVWATSYVDIATSAKRERIAAHKASEKTAREVRAASLAASVARTPRPGLDDEFDALTKWDATRVLEVARRHLPLPHRRKNG